MWENEIIAFWFGFYLLIGIFFLLLLTLMIEHSDHRELIKVLKSLPHCKEGSNAPDKEGED